MENTMSNLNRVKIVCVMVGLFIWPAMENANGQGGKADYERALGLKKATANKVFKQHIRPNWSSDNARFWYRNDLADGEREFVIVDVKAGKRNPAFSHKRLAKVLGKATKQEVSAGRLPIDRLEFAESASELIIVSKGKKWKCNLRTYKLKELSDQDKPGGSLEPSYRRQQSSRTGEDTSITFINKTDDPLEIYWINNSGQRQHYTTLKAGGRHEQHTYAGHVWLVTKESGRMAFFTAVEGGGQAVISGESLRKDRGGSRSERRSAPKQSESPDGKWSAFVRDFNLYLRNNEDKSETQLTKDSTKENKYEEQFNFSPDSRKLVAMRVRPGKDRKINFVESAPKDSLQPVLHTISYRKPGDSVDIRKPQLFDLETKQHIEISDELFANPWSVSGIHWFGDSKRFSFLFNQRGHQVLRIVGVDAETGEASSIVEEKSETFIDYAYKQFSRYIDDANEIIWMSERDGWNHLYLYDSTTGQVKNQITRGEWVVRRVEQVDEEKRQIWFWAAGIRPKQDPYYLQFCRVNFDGSGLVVLTEGDGTHEIEFSPDRNCFIDRWSRVDQPPINELRSAENERLICKLEQADWSELLETGWKVPERFVAKGRDGKTDIYGIIIRPSNFDKDRKYPVIEQIYAGPQDAFVPKSFGLQVKQHGIAELGFIVVQIDGMGTSHRSKAFHDVCWKNLGDSGFPDRILWMKAAAKKYPYMDISRVGIYGGSAGGQSALRAVLAHGDFYKVAAADCGCHDNRMDKIWWNELWMGWPIGPHYEEQSNVTQAHRLEGKLLLTVGELDSNVDPASTMQVVDALIKADKDFDFLIVPGRGHGVGETPYAVRRRMDFFVRHLLGVEPRSEP
jgi:dipeptidyl-peptidase-4